MQPLSRRKRLWFLLASGAVFIVVTPLLIFYATGYRLTEAFKLTRTGGVYISTPESGVEIYLNDKPVKQTSIFQKNVLIQNLKPGEYKIEVFKDGLTTWTKTLDVFPETVTEARTFMLPNEPELKEILENKKIVAALFTQNKTATTTNPKVLGKLSLNNTAGVLDAIWTGEEDSTPSYFCLEAVCKKKIIIQTSSKVKFFDFFPGRNDLVVVSLNDGIYVSEIDDRSKQNIQAVLVGQNLDFRIKDNNIYIKKGDTFYLLSF